ncbi:capsid assembly protein [Enterobacter phage NJ2]|uniref:Capsid assembly protein n=1 Tax=Enterobacter phage NJ2 TaxID=3108955 RepID=A0ABZ0ZX33_9CAUD|nr:capsid assembly protein [Enterobacter phage NJ2]
MAGESNADVYASFGVSSAVMTGGSITEHEQNMLSLDVAARDGDDAILLDSGEDTNPEVDLYGNPDKFADPNETDGFVQVRIGEDGNTAEFDQGEEFQDDVPEEAAEFTPLGETPEELTSTSEQLSQHAEGFQEMVDQAFERGVSQESIERIQAEYEGDGISEKSYAELAAAGYSRAFIDSYIAGQESLVEQYVNQVIAYAGGQERFSALHAHLEANNPDAAATFEAALENRDIGTLRAIINLAGQSYTAKFGRPSARSVTKRATPAKPVARKAEGFTSRDEMIKAMSDSRYRTDAAYRRAVEQKVIDSTF